jgi:hypothetical protein
MAKAVPVVLGMWVLATVVLFGKRPGRDAALFALIGGWAVLPTGVYPPSVFLTPIGNVGTMHALAVPTAVVINKALAIGLGCLLGVVLFDWPAVRRLRPTWLDAPILAWFLVPIAASMAGGRPLAEGLASARYLALAWGVPYLMGRLYLGDNESLRHLGLGLVLAGLLYVPLGVVEFVHGPFLYGLVYGPHPYQIEGAARLIGYRPLVFLEHGNQLGTWIATAAVAAVWLWKSGQMRRVGPVPGAAVAGLLVAACVLFQSHGALILMVLVLVPLLLAERLVRLPRPVHAVIAGGIMMLVVAGSSGLFLLAAVGVDMTVVRLKVRDLFHMIGKTSVTWRLARSEEDLARIAERPILGWAQPDWSAATDGRFINPVNLGLWLTILGSYGIAGLCCVAAILLVPVVEVLRKLPLAEWAGGQYSAVAMAAVLLAMAAVDSLFNSVVLLPLLAGAGGISAWSAGGSPRLGGRSR